MSYKHIICVGVSLIITFYLVFGILYFLNEEKCPVGTFQCANSSKCIPQRSWCDEVQDCPFGDDEFADNCTDYSWGWIADLNDTEIRNCEISDEYLFNAPAGCTYDDCFVRCENTDLPRNLSSNITMLVLENTTQLSGDVLSIVLSTYPNIFGLQASHSSLIVELEKGAFRYQNNITWLYLMYNMIEEILPGHFIGLEILEILNLKGNEIEKADFSDLDESYYLTSISLEDNYLTTCNLKLPAQSTLEEIILDDNLFESITEDLFAECPNLVILSMEKNRISYIDEDAFQYLNVLNRLNLANNRIVMILPDTFQPLINLTYLLIGENPDAFFPNALFDPLKNLESLSLEDINMDHMDVNTFVMLPKLQFAYFKSFHYCMTYAPNVKNCSPSSDGVSSLSDLLGKPLLRVVVWSISCITCLGNSLVLWGRYTIRDDNRVISIMIKNLAVADLLMGMYLFMIAIEDIIFRDNYYDEAVMWMSSWTCTLLGASAMTSSEVSVLILLLISVERYTVATSFQRHSGMTYRSAVSSMIVIWIIGLTLALVPVFYWMDSTRFYGVNGMCFPLHIDDPFMIGWQYSAFVFLGINLLGFMIMGYIYTAMFLNICKTRHSTTLTTTDSEYALRIFLIVLTDAACWIPIIGLKILALMKYPVSPHVYTWVMILILPVNSAINPLLYTFTTSKFRKRFSKGCLKRVHSFRPRQIAMQDLRATTNNNHNKRGSLPT